MPISINRPYPVVTFDPGMRLTPSSGNAIPGTIAAATSVFYTNYLNNMCPIWNGSSWVPTLLTAELSNVLANWVTGSAGPAAGVASKNYDMFVWNNAGTPTLTRGGAWNSDTVRSSTTENDLQKVQGRYCNLNAIANGPAAGYGLYVGTIRTDSGGATVSWNVGAAAAGGTPATINVWNMYNRSLVSCKLSDTTADWTYQTATTRSSNNAATNRISFIRGLNEDGMEAVFLQNILTTAALAGFGYIGIGLDSTNTNATGSRNGLVITRTAAAFESTAMARYSDLPGLGFHFLQATETGDGTNLNTFRGSTGLGAHNFQATMMA